jgi:hypothetical protein
MQSAYEIIHVTRVASGLSLRELASMLAPEDGIASMLDRLTRLEAGEPDADPSFAIFVALCVGIVPDDSWWPRPAHDIIDDEPPLRRGADAIRGIEPVDFDDDDIVWTHIDPMGSLDLRLSTD